MPRETKDSQAAGNDIRTQEEWDKKYLASEIPWDTGKPSSELQRVVEEYRIQPGRAIDVGCGTGSNAVWLATRGFQVTAVDVSPTAIERAKDRAEAAEETVDWIVGDIADPTLVSGPFDFFFDCGCYHSVPTDDREKFLRTLERLTAHGGLGLVLMGNANEAEEESGPSTLREEEIRRDWSQGFEILHLRPFRFDPQAEGEKEFLGWSCLVRRTSQLTRDAIV